MTKNEWAELCSGEEWKKTTKGMQAAFTVFAYQTLRREQIKREAEGDHPHQSDLAAVIGQAAVYSTMHPEISSRQPAHVVVSILRPGMERVEIVGNALQSHPENTEDADTFEMILGCAYSQIAKYRIEQRGGRGLLARWARFWLGRWDRQAYNRALRRMDSLIQRTEK